VDQVLLGQPFADLNPCKHLMAALKWAKDSRHRIQLMVTEYDWSLLSAMSDANLLYTTDAAGAIPPDFEKTRG
jgi:predicted aconitase